MNTHFLIRCGWALALVYSSSALALTSFQISNLSTFNDAMVHDLISTAAVSTAHRAYMPASPLGAIIGLDVGIEGTAIKVPASFRNDIASASQTSADSVPSIIPVPKLNIHKGLPLGIDLGMSYVRYQDKLSLIGGDAKWAFSSLIPAMPLSAALRLNYTSEKLWYLSSSNFQTDLLVSKNLLIIEPYFGTGLQFWSGSLEIPTGLAASSGLPVSVSGKSSGTNVHFFAGLPLKLAAVWLTPEVDYSTVGVTSMGAKFSINF